MYSPLGLHWPGRIFILVFSFLVRKIPFAGVELTSQRVRGLRGTSELPGRPAQFDKYIYIHTYIHTYIPPWEDQCEWHRMTRMTGPDCAVMCNLINIHTYIHTIAVDAARETGETWVESEKNVEKKGLVQ